MADLGNNTVFFQADASNSTGTNPGWPEGMAPSRVNDAARALQGAIKREWDYTHFTATSTGSATAHVLTYGVAPELNTGQTFGFIAGFAADASATLNINGTGVKNIKKTVAGAVVAISAGDFAALDRITLIYDGTQYLLANVAGSALFPGGALTLPTYMVNKDFRLAKGADVASAATTNIWGTGLVGTPPVGMDGNTVHITGTTTITSLGTAHQAGEYRTVIFDGALTLTHNASTLALPGSVNILTAAGDSMDVFADTTTNLRVLRYNKAIGQSSAIASGSLSGLVTQTPNTMLVPPGANRITIILSAMTSTANADYVLRVGTGALGGTQTLQTTGYTTTTTRANPGGGSGQGGAGAPSWLINNGGGNTAALSGTLVLTRLAGTNTWNLMGSTCATDTYFGSAGTVSLGSNLSCFGFGTLAGTATIGGTYSAIFETI